MDSPVSWLPLAAVIAFFAWRFWRFQAVKRRLPELLGRGAVVVDVRSPAEFAGGNRPGSLNIPLDELPARAHELDRTKIIVLCCASGTRSGIARGILMAKGFREVLNAGPWTNTLGS
jgi:rhodanese-related sulfurtransferase